MLEMKQKSNRGKDVRSWKIWDKAVELVAGVLALPLLPFAALERSGRNVGQRSRLAQIRDSYRRTRYEIETASRLPVDFLDIYLKRVREVRTAYLSKSWASQEEAELGYRLMKAAEEALIAEAEAVIVRLNNLERSENSHASQSKN